MGRGNIIGGRVVVEEGHVGLNDFAAGNSIGRSLVASSEERPLGSVDQEEEIKLDSVCRICHHKVGINNGEVMLRHVCPQLRADVLTATTTICDSEDRVVVAEHKTAIDWPAICKSWRRSRSLACVEERGSCIAIALREVIDDAGRCKDCK